jgi:hypothetical protein
MADISVRADVSCEELASVLEILDSEMRCRSWSGEDIIYEEVNSLHLETASRRIQSLISAAIRGQRNAPINSVEDIIRD